MSKRIVLFGELLLRLNPEGFGRLVQADRLQVYFTGGEANAGGRARALGPGGGPGFARARP